MYLRHSGGLKGSFASLEALLNPLRYSVITVVRYEDRSFKILVLMQIFMLRK